MVKNFYKVKSTTKTFFSSKMQVRSYAYGKDIHDEFVKWEEFFFSKWDKGQGRFLLSAQGNIMGSDYIVSSTTKADINTANKKISIPKLVVDGFTYDVLYDGRVIVNGRISPLNIGTEIKAWAIAAVPYGAEVFLALLVIGKPCEKNRTALACYELSVNGPTGNMITSTEYENSLDMSSSLIVLGNHIFTVHNSKLDYHYLNMDSKILEPVAIGCDNCNAECSWCRYVGRNILATVDGKVFWISDKSVYGFSIGYPRQLINIKIPVIEKLIGLKTDKTTVMVFTKNKNTDKKSTYRCMEMNGKYELIPNTNQQPSI